MNISSNFFELFGLPVRFALDGRVLDEAYREMQSRVHPDRFADKGDAEQRLSMQWATRANEAYRNLKKPLTRAIYLLQLRGVEVQAEANTSMPNDFLMEQMEWREAVEEARQAGEVHDLELLRSRLDVEMDARYGEIGTALDHDGDVSAARLEVRKLMFLEKLHSDIDDAIASLEDD